MKKLCKFFILLNAILLSIHAVCPDYPTIPTTSPIRITPDSKGMTNFPSATQQFSITMLITPKVTCSSGSTFNLFSMTIGTIPEDYSMYIDCNDRLLYRKGSQITTTSLPDSFFSSSALGPLGIFLTFDINAQSFKGEVQSDTTKASFVETSLFPPDLYLNDNFEFYLCAGKDGASPKACTISELIFEYRFYDTPSSPHLGGTNPVTVAFYPFTEESLASSIGSAGPAYFGDSESNPSSGTSPSWDSSKNFVTIAYEQFLTLPLPSISSTIPTLSTSFSFTTWLRFNSASPLSLTPVFSMYSSDGTQVGYQLTGKMSGVELSFTLDSTTIPIASTTAQGLGAKIWKLIGFTASLTVDKKITEGTIFVDTSSIQFYKQNSDAMDLSTASLIRIGGGSTFKGDISGLRIMTPGGGITRTTDLCSSDNKIELGLGSFALSCSGTNSLSVADSKCYSTCPSGTRSVTSGASLPLCVSCPKSSCNTCNNIECLTCETDYLFYQGGCLGSCPTKTYSTGSVCENCPTECQNCDDSECFACEANYFLYQGDCLSSCPPQTYSTSTACYDCSTDCEACDQTQCLTCETNYLLYKGGCVDSCPAKSYLDLTSCITCSDHCAECDADGCKACDDNYELNTAKECVLKPSIKVITKEKSGLSGGAIAGIICGSLAVLLLITVFGIRHLKKKNNSSKGASNMKYDNPKTPSDLKTIAVSPINSEANPLVP